MSDMTTLLDGYHIKFKVPPLWDDHTTERIVKILHKETKLLVSDK